MESLTKEKYLKIIGTPVKECKIFISWELDCHWPKLQLVLNVSLINKGHSQSLKELQPFLLQSCLEFS